MKKRYHLFFSGRVQGVGFRFTARHLANKHKINGWVMNLPDGGVSLTAEGKEDNLNAFLANLREEFKSYIINFKLQELPPSGEYKNFQIKL
ncbi:MAG: acylphosphatase [Candidatus Omnitrophica bacterium]|nr:acylphosphatase [Candidatus Omnitrophota bacterium]MBU1809644.1 acylphosphatase [Candidatus Omnitrophota bacterium]